MTTEPIETPSAKAGLDPVPTVQSAMRDERKRPSAKGAVLMAVPLSLIFTTIIMVTWELALWWAVPIYGLVGSAIALLLLLGSQI